MHDGLEAIRNNGPHGNAGIIASPARLPRYGSEAIVTAPGGAMVELAIGDGDATLAALRMSPMRAMAVASRLIEAAIGRAPWPADESNTR